MSDTSDEIGSVGEEALKLLTALQDWAKENGGEAAAGATGMAAEAVSAVGSLNEHIATGGQDCTYCPVCRAVAAVRRTSPEVKEHLAAAAASLMHAAAAAMAPADRPEDRAGADFEKIDISDDSRGAPTEP